MQQALRIHVKIILTFLLIFSWGFCCVHATASTTNQSAGANQEAQQTSSLENVLLGFEQQLMRLNIQELHAAARAWGINPQGMTRDQIEEEMLMMVIADQEGQVAGSCKKKFMGLLFAAFIRRVGLIIQANPNHNFFSLELLKKFNIDERNLGLFGKVGFNPQKKCNDLVAWLLTAPLCYTFPFLMTYGHPGLDRLELILESTTADLSEGKKKIAQLAPRVLVALQNASFNLEELWLKEEWGFFAGTMGDVALFQLLPAFLYKRAASDNNKDYADKKMGDAVIESADSIAYLVKIEGWQLLQTLLGRDKIEALQNNTADIFNYELLNLLVEAVKYRVLLADTINEYVDVKNHTLDDGRRKCFENTDELYTEYKKIFMIHAVTGPLASMLRSEQGDMVTRCIGIIGDKIGQFLVNLGLIKKSTLRATVQGGKLLIQTLAPLIASPTKMQDLHELLQGDTSSLGKNPSSTRVVSRMVVRELIKSLLKAKNEDKTKVDTFWTVSKVVAYLSLWYLYRSDGAGTLQEFLFRTMDGPMSDMSEMQEFMGMSSPRFEGALPMPEAVPA